MNFTIIFTFFYLALARYHVPKPDGNDKRAWHILKWGSQLAENILDIENQNDAFAKISNLWSLPGMHLLVQAMDEMKSDFLCVEVSMMLKCADLLIAKGMLRRKMVLLLVEMLSTEPFASTIMFEIRQTSTWKLLQNNADNYANVAFKMIGKCIFIDGLVVADNFSSKMKQFIKNTIPYCSGILIKNISITSADMEGIVESTSHDTLRKLHFENCTIAFDEAAGYAFRHLKDFKCVNSQTGNSILHFIKRLPHSLEHLDISNNNINSSVLPELFETIYKMYNLQILRLAGCSLDATTATKLIDFILGLENLTELDLSNNPIGNHFLAQLQQSHIPLKWAILNLANTEISDEEALKIFTRMENLRSLKFSQNPLKINSLEFASCQSVSVICSSSQLSSFGNFQVEFSDAEWKEMSFCAFKERLHLFKSMNFDCCIDNELILPNIKEVAINFNSITLSSFLNMHFPNIQSLSCNVPLYVTFVTRNQSHCSELISFKLNDVRELRNLQHLSLALPSIQVDGLAKFVYELSELKVLTLKGRGADVFMRDYLEQFKFARSATRIEKLTINGEISSSTLHLLLKNVDYSLHNLSELEVLCRYDGLEFPRVHNQKIFLHTLKITFTKTEGCDEIMKTLILYCPSLRCLHIDGAITYETFYYEETKESLRHLQQLVLYNYNNKERDWLVEFLTELRDITKLSLSLNKFREVTTVFKFPFVDDLRNENENAFEMLRELEIDNVVFIKCSKLRLAKQVRTLTIKDEMKNGDSELPSNYKGVILKLKSCSANTEKRTD